MDALEYFQCCNGKKNKLCLVKTTKKVVYEGVYRSEIFPMEIQMILKPVVDVKETKEPYPNYGDNVHHYLKDDEMNIPVSEIISIEFK